MHPGRCFGGRGLPARMGTMAASTKPIATYGALLANLVIAIAKFVAAAATRSSAMLAEGIHSAVDTGNQALMLFGHKRSQRPADRLHPFGHGQELYFWGVVVAMLLFTVGGGLSILEGAYEIASGGGDHEGVAWNYGVLGLAFVSEGVSLIVAVRELRKTHPGKGLWDGIRASKDPSVYIVVVEDSAALTGIVVAFLGVFLSRHLGMPMLDPIASILIGCVLLLVAGFLALETRSLLVGEAMDPDLVERIREVVAGDERVVDCRNVLTMHFGPDEVLLNLDVAFNQHDSVQEVAETIDRLKEKVRQEYDGFSRIFLETETIFAHLEARSPSGHS